MRLPMVKQDQSALEIILRDKAQSLSSKEWKDQILPIIIKTVYNSKENLFDEELKSANNINPIEAVDGLIRFIISQIESKFLDSPPFTVLRLVELIIEPTEQGYTLDTTDGLIKYLEALARNLSVTSTIDDYPDIHETLDKENVQSTKDDISLVPIPWLNNSEDETKTISNTITNKKMASDTENRSALEEKDKRKNNLASSPTSETSSRRRMEAGETPQQDPMKKKKKRCDDQEDTPNTSECDISDEIMNGSSSLGDDLDEDIDTAGTVVLDTLK